MKRHNIKIECKTCYYYLVGDEKGEEGFCCRFPPVPVVYSWRRPAVRHTDWCGEWISKDDD